MRNKKNMKNKIVMLTMMSLPIFPINTNASDKTMDYRFDGLSLSTSLGHLSGESREYIYDEDRILSQLNWTIRNATIIKGEINYDFLSWLSVNGKGWTTLAKGSGVMDDYDWLDRRQSGWTDWSHHENTRLNYANELDINLRGWFLNNQNAKLGVAVGYQRNAFSFRARGGCYQYANGDYTGCFSNNEPGIGYQQKFNTPYVGLAGSYLINNLELNATLKWSNWVKANDKDEHYSRNLTFKESGNGSRYHSAIIGAGYHITESTKIFTEASYTRYFNGRASTEIIDNDSGEHYYFPNSAGLDNKNYTVSLGLQYIF